jgi:hypothetical protein
MPTFFSYQQKLAKFYLSSHSGPRDDIKGKYFVHKNARTWYLFLGYIEASKSWRSEPGKQLLSNHLCSTFNRWVCFILSFFLSTLCYPHEIATNSINLPIFVHGRTFWSHTTCAIRAHPMNCLGFHHPHLFYQHTIAIAWLCSHEAWTLKMQV